MVKYAIALAVLALATDASGATWYKVGSTDHGEGAWVETDSLSRGKEYTGVWYRMRGAKGNELIGLAAVKCPSKSYMDLKMTYYESNRESITMDSSLTKRWDLAIPGSLMDSVVSYVCGGSW